LHSGRSNLYWIHGLLVESEIPLVAPMPSDRGNGVGRSGHRAIASTVAATPDYRVVAGEPSECPHAPPPGRILAEISEDGFGFWLAEALDHPDAWTLRYAGICEARLDRRRCIITVHRAPEADPGLIPIFVEGNILAHALAADGLLALHASAVEVDGRALAIIGPSGMGKSTLAALLCAADAGLVSDDVLRVDSGDPGPVCFPGTRALRLRPAAASLAGEINATAVDETADGRTKVVPIRRADAPLPLESAIVPEPSREAKTLEVTRLGAIDGLKQLISHPRLVAWQAPEQIGRLFQLTAEVAPRLRIYRARVPWGPPFPRGVAEELLAHAGIRRRSEEPPDPAREGIAPADGRTGSG
jgi:hypothetical protein